MALRLACGDDSAGGRGVVLSKVNMGLTFRASLLEGDTAVVEVCARASESRQGGDLSFDASEWC
jgi:hypothetical protein